jgi:hypothetical protein
MIGPSGLTLDGVNLVIAIISGAIGLIILTAGTYAIFSSTRKDQTERRLRAWNEDLVRRLDYVEPQLASVEAKNKLLMDLHNPTAKLEQMDSAQRANHEQTVRLLTEQRDILVRMEHTLRGEKG